MTTFIFDFDGTLADTVGPLLSIANDLSREFGFAPLNDAEFQRLRALGTREILSEGRISVWKIPALVRRVKQEQHLLMAQIQIVPGMAEVLWALKARGDRLGIATSNSADNVEIFLTKYGLNDVFDFTTTGITLFGKARVLRKILRQHQLDPSRTIYVGDEVRDMVAAKAVGMHSLGVAWGFNTVSALEQVEADFVIEAPADFLRLSFSALLQDHHSSSPASSQELQPWQPCRDTSAYPADSAATWPLEWSILPSLAPSGQPFM